MKKKGLSILIVLFILLFNIKVNAVYTALEKGENSGTLYNLMPTEVKKGDIISVKVVAKDINADKISYGYSDIRWDKEAFEIVEVNGKYYTVLSDNIGYSYSYFIKSNVFRISYSCNNVDIPDYSESELFEIKFKVKSEVKDNIYEIYQEYDSEALTVLGDTSTGEWSMAYAQETNLRYQVGKPKVVSGYTKDKIENNTYIIGSYMFTRNVSDEYDGILTTDYIMLASSSIKNQTKENMIIYNKNARGDWVNAINNESVTPPEEFSITHIDMKVNYQENGIYSDESNGTILRLVQINDKEVIVTIETDKEVVHGIGKVNNRVVTLVVDEITYKMIITDNVVNIETSDIYITNTKLQKKSNYSIDEYYSLYSFGDSVDNFGRVGRQLYYLKAFPNGKYTNGNYELYVVRTDDVVARVCVKEKGKSDCLINKSIYYREGEWKTDSKDGNYVFAFNENEYDIDSNDYQFELKCSSDCDESLLGVYKKEKSLSMEDIFHIWEKNSIRYNVIFNENNGNAKNYYVEKNNTLNSYYYKPYKYNWEFEGWYLDNQLFDFNTYITKPIILTAKYTGNDNS